jgi:8-oxo-dGTP pyrophosphatase MutT (NUDIX family)
MSWKIGRSRALGTHAIALTPAGRLILVKLRYAPGWRLPGGGRSERESPRAAIIRELREEIGMVAFNEALLAREVVNQRRDMASVFIVRDVEYRPRWSLEIEQVMEADLDALPADLSPRMARWVGYLRDQI